MFRAYALAFAAIIGLGCGEVLVDWVWSVEVTVQDSLAPIPGARIFEASLPVGSPGIPLYFLLIGETDSTGTLRYGGVGPPSPSQHILRIVHDGYKTVEFLMPDAATETSQGVFELSVMMDPLPSALKPN